MVGRRRIAADPERAEDQPVARFSDYPVEAEAGTHRKLGAEDRSIGGHLRDVSTIDDPHVGGADEADERPYLGAKARHRPEPRAKTGDRRLKQHLGDQRDGLRRRAQAL